MLIVALESFHLCEWLLHNFVNGDVVACFILMGITATDVRNTSEAAALYPVLLGSPLTG